MKHCMIIGAGPGIGQASARVFAAAGYSVSIRFLVFVLSSLCLMFLVARAAVAVFHGP